MNVRVTLTISVMRLIILSASILRAVISVTVKMATLEMDISPAQVHNHYCYSLLVFSSCSV